MVLADLFPLLRQSVDWFEDLVVERIAMLEVRSSELKTGLSSSDDPMEVEADTTAFDPCEIRAFHSLGEVCSQDDETLSKFRGRFQFPDKVRVRLPYREEHTCHFLHGEVCFYEAAFLCGLKFPIHPFIIELLGHFNIVPGQLMPNSCVRTYVFHMLGTYVTILCNWLILSQNTLYLYLGRSRMCLIFQETLFQVQVLKPCKSVQESSEKVLNFKAR